VTVCAAALCIANTPAGLHAILLGISDRMITSGDIEFESGTTKIFGFSPASAVCLVAGDTDLGFMVATETHRKVIRDGIAEVEEIARQFAYNYASLCRRRAEGLYLVPLGLDVDSFTARQHQMQTDSVSRIEDQLQAESLGVWAIIAGMGSDGPHVYYVEDPGGRALCCDRAGFCAIGSGGRQFETQFMSLRYDRLWTFHNAMLLMYSAKRRAEISPGVGTATDVFIIDSRGFRDVVPPALEALQVYHNEFESTVSRARGSITERMMRNPLFLPR